MTNQIKEKTASEKEVCYSEHVHLSDYVMGEGGCHTLFVGPVENYLWYLATLDPRPVRRLGAALELEGDPLHQDLVAYTGK
jgi:hypothetical protein